MSITELEDIFAPAPVIQKPAPAWVARCRMPPRQHQIDGVEALLAKPIFLLADQVGAGKTKQVVDAAQILFEQEIIDAVVVEAPAFARGVWANPDPNLGEIAKHSWESVPYACREYSIVNDDMALARRIHGTWTPGKRYLRWLVTNYEFTRRDDRLAHLIPWLKQRRFWLVCDESWALKEQNTAQFEAAYEIRKLALRVTLLNGTPVADTPLDLNAQFKMLDEKILGFHYLSKKGTMKWSTANSRFRERYALLQPNATFPTITGYQNLEELRSKTAPYVIRRRTRDCFDLPPILDPVLIEAKLSDQNWRLYKQMRDDMVAWIDAHDASVAKQAVVKGLRLAQITSGYLGGIEKMSLEEGMLDFGTALSEEERLVDQPVTLIKEIGREKLDAALAWLARNPSPKRLLMWCRFRLEIERAGRALSDTGRGMYLLYGGQSRKDREDAIAALNPAIEPDGEVGVVGHPAAGGAGLNLAGASLAISISQDFSLRVYLQKNGRIDRPGQVNPIRYADVVATGPAGQRTIDHHVLAALRGKEDVAEWTMATWRQKLTED